MGQRVDERELRAACDRGRPRRGRGVRQWRARLGADPARGPARLGIVPASPQRSLLQLGLLQRPGCAGRRARGAGSGLRVPAACDAWTVWVPDDDRDSARLLAARGHALDAAPRAMAMELADLGAGAAGAGRRRAGPDRCARPAPTSTTAPTATAPTASAPASPARRRSAGTAPSPAASRSAASARSRSATTACITGVATPPEHRGRGIASWLVRRALAEARERGMATASLQATRAGAPLYERLGFRDLGFLEMWELRR